MPVRFAAACFAVCLAVLGPPAALAQQSGIPVDAAEVKLDTVLIEAESVGTVLSNESVIVRPEIAGRIVLIGFQEGRPVSEGQLMFQLDDSVYAAELEDAQARLELARRTYQRAQELVQRGAGTQTARDEATATLQTARAAVQLAEARLSKTTIEAPFEGIAGLRRVSVGDYVAEGQEMVNLEDIDPLKVDFSIPERFLGDLRTGQSVRVSADAFPGQTFTGEVYAVDPQIDQASRSVQVRARIPNDGRRLRPGLFVRVNLELARRAQAVIVPEDAIVPRGQDRFVFKLVEGKAVLTQVVLGQRRFGEVEVREGLSAGDTVVTAGQLKLRDGAAVTVRAAADSQS